MVAQPRFGHHAAVARHGEVLGGQPRHGLHRAGDDLQQLDAVLLPNARTTATQLAETISAGLKTLPWVVSLQSTDTDSAGPSPWATQASPPLPQQPAPAAPAQQPAAPAQPPAATADWTACKGNDVDRAMAACTRLIASGIGGTELGTANVYKASNHYKKQQYNEAIE